MSKVWVRMVDRETHIKHKTFKKLFEKVILEQLPDKPCDVAVLCSGGVDSSTCLFAIIELGYNPILYTFHLPHYISEDYIAATKISKKFNLPLKEIIVPTDNIKQDFINLVKNYNCSKKTEVECTFPYIYIFPQITEEYVISGITADSHYGLTKTAMIHYKHPKHKFDKHRIDIFKGVNPECVQQLYTVGERYNKKVITPYKDQRIQKYFLQFSWEEIHKPFQKYIPIMNYYVYFQQTGRRLHSNLQLNSKIPEVFLKLLDDKEFNFNNRKRTMDIVRDYYKKYHD